VSVAEPTLAELLEEWLARPTVSDDGLADTLLGRLEAAVGPLLARLEAGRLVPLTLDKERLEAMIGCERRGGAVLGRTFPVREVDPVARGLLLDIVVRRWVTTLGAELPRGEALLEEARQLVVADRGGGPADEVLARLDGLAGDEFAAWADDLEARAARLLADWPRPEEDRWWRTEERAVIGLAGGAVILSGRFDVVVGGAASGRPTVILEVKSGRIWPEYGAAQEFYALLATVRDRIPPAAVVTVAAGPLGVERIVAEVDVDLLERAAGRVVAALGGLERVLEGRPEERPSERCPTCPVRSSCHLVAEGRV